MIYIEEEDKENIHPNILANRKKVQFSDKFKRYPDQSKLSSLSSLQVTASKQSEAQQPQKNKKSKANHNKTHEPEVSYFQIDELKNLSKQISLKNVSHFNSRRSKQLTKESRSKLWTKSIMQPSQAQLKLLEKIDHMLEKQTFKPIYSTISRNKKVGNFNTMASEAIFSSDYQSNSSKSNVIYSKSNSPEPNNKTSTLSELINLSKLSNLSNKTLERYLMCLEKERIPNELQKSHKVSEFNLLDTDRSKDRTFQKKPGHIQQIEKTVNKQYEELKKQIQQVYELILSSDNIHKNSNVQSVADMIEAIKSFVKQKTKVQKNYTFMKKGHYNEDESTCFIQE